MSFVLGLGMGLSRGSLLDSSFFRRFGTPKLGYTLMPLKSGSINQYRTRRSSDDTEQDFNSAETSNGTLVSFVDTNINLYTSNFSAGVNGFVADTGVTSTAPETVASVDDTLKLTLDASSGQHFTNRSGPFNADGSTVNISFEYYIPSTNSVVDTIRLWNGFGGDGVVEGATLDAWTSTSGTITNDDGSNLRVQALDGASLSFSGASGDVIYVKNIVVTQTNANGHITTLYNIGSASSANLAQSTATRQPEIVHLSTLETIGSDPAINWSYNTGVLHKTSDADFQVSDTFSIDIDFETGSDVSTRQTLVINRGGASDIVGLVVFFGRLYFEGFNGGALGGYVSVSANTRYKATLVWNGSTFSAAFLNGASASITSSPSGLLGNSTTGSLQLGGHVTNTSNPFLGKLTSLLFYTGAKDLAHNIGFNAAY